MQRIVAWSVHIFTATGTVIALLALRAVEEHRWTAALLWLFAALVVDGVDGTLARAARTKELAPRIDGEVLDLVIDYLNYVFVPTIFMLEVGMLPQPLALPLAALIQLSSLYVFARKDMKTEDGYFRGFPALWNVVALYLYAAGIGQSAAAVIVATFVLLTFAPVHVVHPCRGRDYGPWLWLVALAWAMSTVALLLPIGDNSVRNSLLWLSSLSAVVLILLGLRRTLKRKGRDGRPPRPIS
jgi:phosphatidylcholine synthase